MPLNFTGNLMVHYQWDEGAGYEAQDSMIVLPVTLLSYYPDTCYLWEDFESGTLPPGWDARYHDPTSPGWQISDHSSSMFFSIPQHSWFAFVNSDAQGEEAYQDDWLISPPLEVSAEETEAYLVWEAFFSEEFGGSGEVLLTRDPDPDPHSDWTVIMRESGVDSEWESHWYNLAELIGTGPFRLAFHFAGHWSQGFAVDNLSVVTASTALRVADGNALKASARVPTPFPNPFNPVLEVPFYLDTPGKVRLELFDLLGRRVLLQEEYVSAGKGRMRLSGNSLAAGIYFLKVKGPGISETFKVALVK
jgi:hypothetical protein